MTPACDGGGIYFSLSFFIPGIFSRITFFTELKSFRLSAMFPVRLLNPERLCAITESLNIEAICHL